jgi:hypothetical protein
MSSGKAGIRVDTRQLEAATGKLKSELEGMSAEHVSVVSGLLPGVRMRTPHRTGALLASWDAVPATGGAAITSELEYAAPQEYGVSGRFEGARMVRDTLEAEQEELKSAYERELLKAGARAGFGTT